MSWKRVCSASALEPGEALQFADADPPVAVFNVDGEFLAIDDTCTHDKYSLADGYIEGDEVECSWHFAKFCLRTGAALTAPATVGVRTYPVEVAGDDVLVMIPDSAT